MGNYIIVGLNFWYSNKYVCVYRKYRAMNCSIKKKKICSEDVDYVLNKIV